MGSTSPHSRLLYVFWLGEWASPTPFLRICEMGKLYAPAARKGMAIPTYRIQIYWASAIGVGWGMDISYCREEAILANAPTR